MKLVGVQKILNQSDWLKKYNDFNTDKRKNAVESLGKDFLSSLIIVFMAKQ